MQKNDIQNRAICKKTPQLFATLLLLAHRGSSLCVLSLADERQYDINRLFLGLAIHFDDQIVVTGVIA